MVGFAHAALALGGSFSLGISHLRVLNPYVVTGMKVPGEAAVLSACLYCNLTIRGGTCDARPYHEGPVKEGCAGSP